MCLHTSLKNWPREHLSWITSTSPPPPCLTYTIILWIIKLKSFKSYQINNTSISIIDLADETERTRLWHPLYILILTSHILFAAGHNARYSITWQMMITLICRPTRSWWWKALHYAVADINWRWEKKCRRTGWIRPGLMDYMGLVKTCRHYK